ncbi:multidrug effflux MFS transporter [Janibacter sp. G56]|uniref:multidrug effflux MFS transporter n=1 Tax=Janibacter sp. G56 TaxID=3418717 RepID=UPI003D02D2C5
MSTTSDPNPAHATAVPTSRAGTLALVGLLAVVTMIGPFTIDTIFPAFEVIGRDLGGDKVELQQLISIYLLSFAAASIVHGPLSDALGRKPVMVGGLLLYAGASVLCALATSMPLLLLARAVQGLFAGAGLIIARTVVRDLYSGPDAQRFMSQMSMVFGIAPAIAPIVGGWLLGWSSWQGIFWVLAVYGVLLAGLVALGLPESHPPQDRTPVRVGPIVRSLWQCTTDVPVLRLAAAAALNFAGLFLYISSAPAIVVDHLGLGERDFGVLFIPIVGAMIVGSWLSGRLAERTPKHTLVMVGFGLSLIGAAFQVAHEAVSSPSLPWTVAAPAFLGIGMALAFPVIMLDLLELRPRQRGTVSSVQSLSNTLLNALVAGVVSPFVSHSMTVLALVAGACTLAAAGLWIWHVRVHPAVADSAAVSTDTTTDA